MIKIVALDIYGTVLATNDSENALLPRAGIEDFFDHCDSLGIKVASASDADIDNVKRDLTDSNFDISRFDRFFRLDQLPYKDFSVVIGAYDITRYEMIVIGDSYKDIEGAMRLGIKFIHVPEYTNGIDRGSFDFSKIDLRGV